MVCFVLCVADVAKLVCAYVGFVEMSSSSLGIDSVGVGLSMSGDIIIVDPMLAYL